MKRTEDHARELGASSVILASVMDLTTAEPLCQTLLERLATADLIVVQAAGVERISTAVIQVLLAAAVDARTRGIEFRLETPSEPLACALKDLGLAANFGC